MNARDSLGNLTGVALTTLVGVHALRTFLSMVVWNIGEDRSSTELGLIALGFWSLGFLAWPIGRWVGGSRPELRFALLFSALYALDHFVSHPVITPAFGVATAVVWLWLFPTSLAALGRREAGHVLLPGILLGLTGQVAMQAAMQGLDLPVLHGIRAGAISLLVAVLLCASILRLNAVPSTAEEYPNWGLAAVGPYLAIQLTLLVNLGRVQSLSGWELPASAALVLLALVTACAAAAWNAPRTARLVAAFGAVVLLVRPAWLEGSGVWLLVAVQVLLAIAVAGVLAPTPGRAGRVFGWTIAAALLLFALIFLFYSRYEWPQLWVVMAALAVIPVLVPRPLQPAPTFRAAVAAGLVGVVGLAITIAGGVQAQTVGTALKRSGPAPRELTVATYNIHEALNYWSLPDPEAVARTIETLNADVIGLQEVGRGWNVNGGPDLLAWLRWRLPQYRVVYAPMLGDLVGHVILSRYPIKESGWRHYPRRASRLSYGLTWAVIPTSVGDLLFIATHFSPYAGYEADRAGQAGDLLDFWAGRPRSVLVGDFNAVPDEPAIQRLLGAGWLDVAAPHGLDRTFTYASGQPHERIDYIFSTPDVDSLAAAVPPTLASDHLPVTARVRLH
ncbi:MAG TPA: endonuclease/exonuclease/phosphatase family protein [bacterium]|nr:endonuclease/exonuclease/phosphatase family protein [bacterium]